mmetsp:Transcript_126168/g.403283  ORF Transcript_126168/g.403283 Transcript_126168/m.403283 type:complete len:327 (+) Transcript_126168:843-1823(+)
MQIWLRGGGQGAAPWAEPSAEGSVVQARHILRHHHPPEARHDLGLQARLEGGQHPGQVSPTHQTLGSTTRAAEPPEDLVEGPPRSAHRAPDPVDHAFGLREDRCQTASAAAEARLRRQLQSRDELVDNGRVPLARADGEAEELHELGHRRAEAQRGQARDEVHPAYQPLSSQGPGPEKALRGLSLGLQPPSYVPHQHHVPRFPTTGPSGVQWTSGTHRAARCHEAPAVLLETAVHLCLQQSESCKTDFRTSRSGISAESLHGGQHLVVHAVRHVTQGAGGIGRTDGHHRHALESNAAPPPARAATPPDGSSAGLAPKATLPRGVGA